MIMMVTIAYYSDLLGNRLFTSYSIYYTVSTGSILTIKKLIYKNISNNIL